MTVWADCGRACSSFECSEGKVAIFSHYCGRCKGFGQGGDTLKVISHLKFPSMLASVSLLRKEGKELNFVPLFLVSITNSVSWRCIY